MLAQQRLRAIDAFFAAGRRLNCGIAFQIGGKLWLIRPNCRFG